MFRCDPVTVEVIANQLMSTSEEMSDVMIRAAYSDNIKERHDVSAGVFDARGRTLAQAARIPILLGSMLGGVNVIVDHDDLHPGDLFLSNDPFLAGGTHLNDIVAVAPVFVDGELVAFVSNCAHHADFFDRGDHRHIWQEGLRIPVTRIVEAGKLREDVFGFILVNCQLPEDRKGDFRAQFASLEHGVKRVEEAYRRFGRETIQAATEDILDHSERLARSALAEVQAGTFTFSDYLDSPYLDEPLLLKTEIEIDEARNVHMRFPDAPPQGANPLNMNETALEATCLYTLLTLLGTPVPLNEGVSRLLQVEAPKGTILNCTAPVAVDSRTNTAQRVVDLIHGALADAMPDRITAAHNGGNTEVAFSPISAGDGIGQFRYSESAGGGLGARATKDGIDGAQAHVTNTSNLPIEVLETTYPFRVRRYELAQDSGGAGKFRGGMGFHRDLEVVDRVVVGGADVSRSTTSPWGLFGGEDGGNQKIHVIRKDGSVIDPEYTVEGYNQQVLEPGSLFQLTTSGGGGYGPKSERDPERVAKDLREGRISEEAAARHSEER